MPPISFSNHSRTTQAWFAALVLLVSSAVGTLFWSFSQIEQAAQERRQVNQVVSSANDFLSALKDAETGQRGYLLTNDDAFLEPYLAVRDSIKGRLEVLKQLASDSPGQIHLTSLTPLVQAYMLELSQAITMHSNKNQTAAQALVSNAQGKHAMDVIRAHISRFIQSQDDNRALREANFESDMHRLFSVIVIVSLLALLAAVFFAWWLYRETGQHLKNLVHLETRQLLENQEVINGQLQQTNLMLRVSEEKLTVTLNSIGDAVIATDVAACVTLLNPVAQDLTGWTQAQAVGHSIDDVFNIVNKETRKAATIPVAQTLAHGTVQGLANHTVLIARDAREFDIADSCAPIRDALGTVVGAVLVFRNVTDEYAVQQSLRDSAALVQTILNTVVDGIVTIHAHGGVIESVNPAIELMFGYSAADLGGKHLSQLIPELDQDQHTVPLAYFGVSAEARANGVSREVLGQRKNGSAFPLEIAVSEMMLGGQRYFTGILRDITARKQFETALLKAGALQKAIINSANFSSIATDAKGVIQIFNVGAERMLGYAAAEVMNIRTPADISDPQEVIERAKSLSAELATEITPGFEALVFKAARGIEDIYELTYIRKDGSRFPAVVSVTALRDDEDTIIGYLLIGTDNTARKQAEEALLKAGALQKAIFDSANFSSIATDAKGVIQIFNVGAERMLGYAAAEVMNIRTPADISDPQEVIERAKSLSAELATEITPGFEALVFKAARGIEDIYELTYIRKDGSRFPAVVSVTALRDDEDTIIGYLLIGTDNTARKQAEEALLKAGALQKAIFDSANFSSIATDAKGVIQIFNVGAERMLGYAAADVMNKITPADISDPQEVVTRAKALSSELGTSITPGFEALVFKASRGIEDIYELTYIRKDGSRFPAVVSVTALRDAQDDIIGYLLIGTDNTARKQIEAERTRLEQVLQNKNLELEGARQVAETANQAKSDFLSSMSHELRSPLNAILGFGQLLESGEPAPTPTQMASVGQILKAGWYLLELINEILDLALIESGRLSLSLEPTSLHDLFQDCQAMIEPQAKQRGIHLKFAVADSDCYVNADRTRLKQVLINLLSNAIKYNKSGGLAEVSYVKQASGRLRISVTDSGEGLSPEKIAMLFQSFNRLGQESGTEEGTGIGLVVSRRLVELMQGEIGAQSTVGAGSVFWFELNAVSAPQWLADSHDGHTLATLPGQPGAPVRTLLYVEDNRANMELVEQLIARQSDMRLIGAPDAMRGIAMARAYQPDVILMDINLPGISGMQALQILRDDPSTEHIPVLALSANAMPRDIEKGLTAGFYRYLTKPIRVNEFLAALDEGFKMAQARTTRSPLLTTS
jgi:PAS domain S-box-containing protein